MYMYHVSVLKLMYDVCTYMHVCMLTCQNVDDVINGTLSTLQTQTLCLRMFYSMFFSHFFFSSYSTFPPKFAIASPPWKQA